MAKLPPSPQDIVLAHFIVSGDVERSRRFYTEVLGGTVAFSGPGGLTYLIEVGQTTDPDGDWTPTRWPSGTPAATSG